MEGVENALMERKAKKREYNRKAYQNKKTKSSYVDAPQTEELRLFCDVFGHQEAGAREDLYDPDLSALFEVENPQETSHAFHAEVVSPPLQQLQPTPLCPPPLEETPYQDPPTEYVPISLVHVFSAFTFRITRTSCCPTEHIGVRSARRRTISFCLATHGDSNCFFCSASFRTETAAGFFAR